MFGEKVEQVSNEFGFGEDKTRQLVGALVSLILNAKGGSAGFLRIFREKGFNEMVNSWMGSGPCQPISPAYLESTLGAGILEKIGHKTQLSHATVGNAIAALLPDAVRYLSPNGNLISNAVHMPEDFREWLGNINHWSSLWLSAAPASVAPASVAPASVAPASVAPAPVSVAQEPKAPTPPPLVKEPIKPNDPPPSSGGMRLWPWLLLLLLILAAVFLLRNYKIKGIEAPAVSAPPTPAAISTPAVQEPAPPPAPQIDSRLVILRNGDKVTYEGSVDSEATKTALIESLGKTFGADKIGGDIIVDPQATAPSWLGALAGFLPEFTMDGAQLIIEGNKINLGGTVADEAAKMRLLDKLKTAFGGFSFGGLFEGLNTTVSNTAAAAENTTPRASDPIPTPVQSAAPQLPVEDLSKMLSSLVIHFDLGHTTISSSNTDLLKVAEIMKQAPTGTKFEVAAHTDSIGPLEKNRRLSQQRADTVRNDLIKLGVSPDAVTSKGYGEGKPVADNRTAEGRSQNRRLEFTVQE